LGSHLPTAQEGTSDRPGTKMSSKRPEGAGYQPVLE
jgi:hypothetical protein